MSRFLRESDLDPQQLHLERHEPVVIAADDDRDLRFLCGKSAAFAL
jgi:hypothetical protein